MIIEGGIGSATPVNPVQLSATPVGGFAPLNVTFSVVNHAPGTFQQVEYDFNGDGMADQTANNLNAITHLKDVPAPHRYS